MAQQIVEQLEEQVSLTKLEIIRLLILALAMGAVIGLLSPLMAVLITIAGVGLVAVQIWKMINKPPKIELPIET